MCKLRKEESVWGVSTSNVRAGNYTRYARLSGYPALQKDGSIFYEMDIERRAINIPLDFQLEGLVLEIDITNCDGTKYKKIHHFVRRETTKIRLTPMKVVSRNLDLRFSSFINS